MFNFAVLTLGEESILWQILDINTMKYLELLHELKNLRFLVFGLEHLSIAERTCEPF